MDNSNIVPLYGISSSGSEMLQNMSQHDDLYKQFLKLQGRLYKFPATVALEFFAQKPDTDCIGTEAQWNRQGYSLKTGAESVHFIDSSGNLIDYYDYSQMENNQGQPRRWMITAENAEDIKQILSETNTIPDNNTTIISMSLYCTDIFADVTECMNKLHIPQDDRKAFFSAYVNAYSLIVAGRLEVNAQPFNITPDMSFFKRFGSDVEKMTFLSYAGRTARTALKVIENAVMTYDEKRRNIDDLRNIYESDGGRTEQSNGRGTSNDPERAAEELSDIIENAAERRNPRMGSVEGVSGGQENGMVSSVQGETGNVTENNSSVSVQPVQWNLHNASGPESGEVNDRGADRNVRTDLDGLHAGELSDRNRIPENEAQVSDVSETGTGIGMGVQGTSGAAVRQGESPSEPDNTAGIQRYSGMGDNETVLRGRTGDERESSDLSDGNRLNDKLNSVFSEEETEKPSTNDNLADGFVLSDADRLIEITGSISEKSAEIIHFTTNGEYDKAVAASSELAELTRKANELKERINGDPLTNKDVAALQDITPKRKSVKNMLDADMAKAPKFEEKLNSELGEKSPFKRLPSGSRATEDTRIPVIEVADRNSTLDSVRNDIKDRTIIRGSVTNHDTGWDIQISRNGLEDTVHNAEKFNDTATLDMLYSLSDIVENSVILDSAVADDNSEMKAFMHSLYGIYRRNDEVCLTKMYAEEFLNGNQGTALRLHNVQSIKIEPSRHVEFAENQLAPSVLNGSDISIADLTNLVKAYDKRFFENPTAVGRIEREAEIFKAAELEDAQATIDQGEEVKTNATQQISAYGESHELTVSNAEDELREKVDTSINFPTGEMSDEIFREKLIDAIADVAQANELSLEQQRILRRFCNFATKYRLTENIIDSAFSKAPVFRTNYKDRDYLNEHFFGSKLNDIENALNSAIQQHLTPVASENLIINFPEYNFTIDLTKSDRFVMENSYDAYVGGIDSNGHERKDNFREIHESLTVGIDEYGKLYTEKYDEANESFPYELYTYVDSQIDDLKFTVTEFIDNSSYNFTAYSVVDGEKEFEPVLKKDEVIDNREYSELSRDAVNSFCINVNGSEADFSNMKKIDIASDSITDRNVPVSVSVDLDEPAIMYYVDNRLFRRDNFDSLELFYNNVLSSLENGRNNLYDIGVPDSDFIEFYEKNAVHGNWQFYIIADLKTWSTNSEDRSPLERYDSLDKAISRFNELRNEPYNADNEEYRGFPYAHLTMGISNGSAELDILQVRNNNNYLVTDYTRYPKYVNNEAIHNIVNDINEFVGIDRVMDFPKNNNGDPDAVIDVAYTEWQQPVIETVPDEQPIDKAKRLINQFCQAEFDSDADFSDLNKVSIAYTTLTDEELPIYVTADLETYKMLYEFDNEVYKIDEYNSLEEMNIELENLSFDDLIDVPSNVIDRHTEYKYEIYQLKSGEENHYLRFESYDDIRKHGYEVDFKNYDKVYEGDLTDDTTLESLFTKFNLDHPEDFKGHSLSVSDIIVLHRHGDLSANYVDPIGYKLVPEFFRTMHEQKVDTNINSEITEETTGETKPVKTYYSQNAYVDGINTYKLLIDEVRRGTGFENGKERVLEYYQNNQPTIKELAAFLKKEYGIGGHSGNGDVSMVDYDSKGITFSLKTGAKYTHSWLNVAAAIETQIKDKTYDRSQRTINDIKIGDRYRLKSLFGDYEVIVTGDKGIYPDEVVVTDIQNSDRLGYAVTYNMARINLHKDGVYLGNEESMTEKVDTSINSPVKSSSPVIKNLSQLKKQLEVGMEFEITAHLRPECVGERRVVTSKNTVEFTSQKIDENGQPSGKDLHMEWGKAADWTFDNDEFTASIFNEFTNERELVMSFHIAENRENISKNENIADEPLKIERTSDYLYMSNEERPFAIPTVGNDADSFEANGNSYVAIYDEKTHIYNGIYEVSEYNKAKIYYEIKNPSERFTIDDLKGYFSNDFNLITNKELAKFLAVHTPSSDEWEDMAFPMFEKGYIKRRTPSDKTSFGYNLHENELYKLSERFQNGEDIRKELALGLLNHTNENIEFVFEEGKISDRTYYYSENERYTLHTVFSEDSIKCTCNGTEREIAMEDIGQAFIDRISDEWDDMVVEWVHDDLNITHEETWKLIAAFDNSKMAHWEDNDNQAKINRIKKALYNVLGDEDLTEKAFESIAKNKYGIVFDDEKIVRDYGYDPTHMNPVLSTEKALELFDKGEAVYLLYPDNTESQALERSEIEEHYGYFGIEKESPNKVDTNINSDTDDFSDINTAEIRRNLEENGIVNGVVADEEKLNNSPFIQQVIDEGEQLSLMSDSSEITETATPKQEVKAVKLEYTGNADDLNKLRDTALSIGATVIIDNANSVISVDTYENHVNELNSTAETLGLTSYERPEEKVDTNINSENTEKKRRTIQNRLYDKFCEMFPDIADGKHIHERYGNKYVEDGENDEFEPLSVERTGSDTYAFMVWYVQNGDLMRDPDFTFELDHEEKTLTIIDYQQDGTPMGTFYQAVFDENGNADKRLLNALSSNFSQVLDITASQGRPLTEYTTMEGDTIEVTVNDNSEKEETPLLEAAVANDKSAEWREVLNEYSRKHGLGELNIYPPDRQYGTQVWTVKEKMKDGYELELFDLSKPHTDSTPFNNDTLRTALEENDSRIENLEDYLDKTKQRKGLVDYHGLSDLPDSRKLPDIIYADKPSEKIYDNIEAIREVKRLIQQDADGLPRYRIDDENDPDYEKAAKVYMTKERSDEILRHYSGWGGLPQIFDERYTAYSRSRATLKELLTPQEYAEARSTTLNAHFTPQEIIDAMYDAITAMDLPRNARILEPSCGTGNFITRLPNRFKDCKVTGIEIDPITAKIAESLNNNNPNVKIINSGFEHADLDNDSFDLAIGNVPFGDYKMIDPDFTKDYNIHDAFFRRALNKVAPGGIVAFITSSGTMDKKNPQVREHLATYAELVGAVRLPDNAFASAGTKVTTDIIFLQKRETPLQPFERKPDWCYTAADKNGLRINSYFVKNQNMVLGNMEKTSHFDMLTCRPIEGADLKELLSEAIKNINAKVSINRRETLLKTMRNEVEPWGKNFTYQVKDDKVYYRRNGAMDEIGLSAKDKKMVIALCDIRDIARKLIDLQKTEISDNELVPIRKELNEKYDKFVSDFDYLTSKTVTKKFGNDSDYQLLRSLENITEKEYTDKNGETQTKQSVEKAAIFSERTVNAEVIITEVETAEEALEVALDRKGRPDIQYMASLLMNKYPDNTLPETAQIVCNELIEKGYLFDDPSKAVMDKPFSGICEKAEYLSGNVRVKLAFAEDAAAREPEKYTRNVEALKTVIPADIHAEEISVRMGCTWIDPSDYTEFLHHLSGRTDYDRSSHEVHYFPATGNYEISESGKRFGYNVKETSTYGYNSTVNMYKIAENVLNQKKVSVYKTVDDKRVLDANATRVANDKARQMKEEFKKWIFADDKRKAKYERRYNDIFNSIVGRDYDGSKLTFPAMNKNFNLRPHQKNCVARAIYGGNTLAAHVVGAGKSAVMFTTVMKKKQLGLISKACVVVPKPLVEQTANEWLRVYPDAKLLTVTNKDLSDEKNRELFMSRVATGSYDGIIMSQEQFEKIPMTKAFIEEHIGKQIDQLEDAKNRELNNTNGVKTASVKEMEKAIKIYKGELERLLNPKSKSKAKDSILNFEQLGFDYLVVDEAHSYKNGKIMTKMKNISGVNTKASGRSADMFLKSDYFNTTFGDGRLLYCTGTPVSNSMTELYVMTRFLRPDLLKAADVELFDNWAATFGNVVTGYKQGADGQLKLKTSFSQFANLPELMAMYKEFADIQSAEKLNLPRPNLKGDKPQIVVVDASPEQKQYVKDLAERAKRIANGEVDPSVDNLLKITSEARMIGFGNLAVKSLYNKNGFDIPEGFMENEKGKVDKCVEKVIEIYNKKKAEGDTKAVQIVFSDIAVNSDNGNFSAYQYIRNALIESKQIPEDEIIFAPKSDAKDREDIFKKINEGKYRVVIASTNTLGTGANIQNNLYALHHLDIPWKPSDFSQREGRILRQGNNYPEVEIFNYITKGTLDSYLYQTVTDKARFIAQLMDNKCPSRVCEDCDEKVLTYGEIQAAAEDNPDFRLRIEKGNELAELKLLQSSFYTNKANLRETIEQKTYKLESSRTYLENLKKDKVVLPTEMSITKKDGKVITDTKEMREFIADLTHNTLIPLHAKDVPDFKVGDFEVRYGRSFADHTFMFEVKNNASVRFEAGTDENSDNYIRLKNLFENSYDTKIKNTTDLIYNLETDIEQAKEEIQKPFAEQDKIDQLEKEIEELEEKLVSIKEQKDEIIDPDEIPIKETAAERAEREARYGDDNDYTPDDNNSIGSR